MPTSKTYLLATHIERDAEASESPARNTEQAGAVSGLTRYAHDGSRL